MIQTIRTNLHTQTHTDMDVYRQIDTDRCWFSSSCEMCLANSIHNVCIITHGISVHTDNFPIYQTKRTVILFNAIVGFSLCLSSTQKIRSSLFKTVNSVLSMQTISSFIISYTEQILLLPSKGSTSSFPNKCKCSPFTYTHTLTLTEYAISLKTLRKLPHNPLCCLKIS